MSFPNGGNPVENRELPLMGRLDAPSAAPAQLVAIARTYREAVRLAWQVRRVHNMTRRQLAAEAELIFQHVTDYLHADDRPGRRDLPASKIPQFEAVVGNTLVSQWLAGRCKLTVLEEVMATRAAA
jgi:hypothetical protein